jgi:hypothetical protein
MSMRRLIQIIAFVSALAFSFSAPMASTANACDPQSAAAGLC